MKHLEGLEKRVDELKADGLIDLNFYAGVISETTVEQFCEEANRLLDSISQGNGRPLNFNDSSMN